jgi:16S rRNA (uracil1498-N3)-methyltransferase
MRRFYIAPEMISQGRARLDPSQTRHLVRVLRMNTSDEVVIFDGKSEFIARVAEIKPKEVTLDILREIEPEPGLPFEFWLAQALIKGPRMDWAIEKATELGVTRFIPMQTARCAVRAGREPREKLSRWRKIAQSAAAQSGRKDTPLIESPRTFENIINERADIKVLLWEGEKNTGLEPIIQKWNQIKTGKSSHTIMLMIGPEGGFTAEEVNAALAQGWQTWGLGRLVLRSETAAIVGTAILMHVLAGQGG